MTAVDPTLRRAAAHVVVDDIHRPVLTDDAAHHIRRVLRVRDGASVTVTDGAGSWRACVLAGGVLEVVGPVTFVPRSGDPLTLAVSPPKGDRLDWMVAKATELGVDRIVLIESERTVVRLQDERADRQLARLARIAAESAMQSRRLWLPVIEGPSAAGPWLADAGTVVAEPGGRPLTAADTTIVIGPEGGWADHELAGVSRDRLVGLGDAVLRVETAAIAACVLVGALRTGGGNG